jgi:hypothetical protein
VATPIIHGDGDPKLTAKPVRNAPLKAYHAAPHGLAERSLDKLNADLLDFLKA